MLSGVGPTAHLQEHKIPVVHDLEGIGANLADHNRVPILYETVPGYSFNAIQSSIPKATYYLYRSIVHGDGPMVRPIIEAACYLRIPVTTFSIVVPLGEIVSNVCMLSRMVLTTPVRIHLHILRSLKRHISSTKIQRASRAWKALVFSLSCSVHSLSAQSV